MDELYAQLLEKTVSLSSMVCMIITGILAVAIPIALAIYFKKKYNCDIKPFFAGALAWIVFARIFEGVMHQLVLRSPVGNTILGNILLYALYGGAAAAIFEETGRLVIIKTTLRHFFDNDKNALMFGAGHGGIESVLLLGLSMFSNLAAALTINTHELTPLYEALKTVSEEEAVTTLQAYIALSEYPAALFFLGVSERIFAIALHIALSVLVWKAVKESKMVFFVYALLGHFLADFLTGFLSGLTPSVVVAELIVILVLTCIVTAIYFIVTKSKSTESIQ